MQIIGQNKQIDIDKNICTCYTVDKHLVLVYHTAERAAGCRSIIAVYPDGTPVGADGNAEPLNTRAGAISKSSILN